MRESGINSLLDYLPDMTAIIDEHMAVLFMNDSMSRSLDYRAEEITGLPIDLILHPEDIISFSEEIRDTLCNHGTSKKAVYRIRKKKGQYIWCECTFRNSLSNPAVEGIIISLHDITKYIDREARLKADNEELTALNEQLDRFVYGVSHDLRAPLSSILGIVNYSELDVTDPDLLKSFSLIKSSIARLDKFIRDILDYSRNLKSEVKVEKIDFKELLDDVTGNLKYMSENKVNVTIRSSIDGNSDFYSDRSRISIVLSNLVSNALRYHNPKSPDPFVEIRIKVSDNHAHITVRDNGIGISSDNLKKIFDMFFRVSTGSSGSGLGLYIVKDTIEKLNGDVQVRSELGMETIFEVKIPDLCAQGQPNI